MINYDGLYKKDYYGEKLSENHFSEKNLGFQVIKVSVSAELLTRTENLLKEVLFIWALEILTRPKKKLNIARKLSFISECWFTFGGIV